MRAPAIACGMLREARTARTAQPVALGAGRRAQLEASLLPILELGPSGVLSFGVCGGLDPLLEPGTIVVGDTVLGASRSWQADPAWTRQMLARLPMARSATILGRDLPLVSEEAKAGSFVTTGASVVDMESHVVAELSAAHGIPFAVLRVVLDPARDDLPDAARVPLRTSGDPDLPAILLALARRPAQVIALLRLARFAGLAFRQLARCRTALGPTFAIDLR